MNIIPNPKDQNTIISSVFCCDLLKGDVGDTGELDEIVQKGHFKKACPVFVFTASGIIQELIEQP